LKNVLTKPAQSARVRLVANHCFGRLIAFWVPGGGSVAGDALVIGEVERAGGARAVRQLLAGQVVRLTVRA
jgi:hypothetical protein